MSDALSRLVTWYQDQCNDDWEHQYGVRIDTLDNPGWSLRVDLRGTALMGSHFADFEIERSDHDWVRCRLVDDQFEGFGGPTNLSEIIGVFVDWVDSQSEL